MKTNVKAKKLAPTQKASNSSKGKRITAARRGVPAALNKTITAAKVNTAAAVNSGQIVEVPSRTPSTWDSIRDFDPTKIETLSPLELAEGINGLAHLLDQALSTTKHGMHWSVQIACQIGLLAKVAKKRLPHGKFREWHLQNCSWLSERTLQRYMAISNASQMADLKAGTTLQGLYSKLGKIVDKGATNAPAKKANEKKPHVAEEDSPVNLATLFARLRATGEFLQTCVEDLPFDSPDAASVDELLSEIESLVTTINAMKSKALKARTPEHINVFELPLCSNGPALRAF